MTHCVELIAFSILPERRADFLAIKETLASEAQGIEGLLSSTTLLNHEGGGLDFVDVMVWSSREAATLGFAVFSSLPTTEAFMSMMAGPPRFSGHFAHTAGNAIVPFGAPQ